MRRYGLSDSRWERIKDLLPGREGNVGGTAADRHNEYMMIDSTVERRLPTTAAS